MSKETAIVKTETELPDYLREAEAMGDYKGFDRSEITIPMLMIAQDGNPICKKGHDQYIPGMTPGAWFSTNDHQVYGESVKLIFIDSIITRGIYSPAPESKFIREFPENEFLRIQEFLQYDAQKRGSIDVSGRHLGPNEVASERHRIFCVMPDFPKSGMMILYLKPGSFQAERKWKDAINIRGVPHHKAVWELPLVLDKNDKGDTWYNFAKGRDSVVKFDRYVTRDEFALCDKLYKEFNRAASAAVAPIVEDSMY